MDDIELLPLLAKANLLYQGQYSREEIDALCAIFAEVFEGEDSEAIARAFALYFRQGKRFPTPAHILELLPECRPACMEGGEEEAAITPGFGQAMAMAVLEKLKRPGCNAESTAEVCSRVMSSLGRGEIVQ